MPRPSPPPVVGGVFALGPVSGAADPFSLLSTWSRSAAAVYYFHNARSAVRHVLKDVTPRRLWLPAYACASLATAAEGLAIEVRYYPVDRHLRPRASALARRLAPGDAVLGIDYFGRPAPEWRELATNMPDVTWIEDCSQVVDIGDAYFADLRIFSPRKIVGAPDGGILVDVAGKLSPPTLAPLTNDRFEKPYRMRAEDPDGDNHEEWYRAFREAEEAMSADPHAMSRTSRSIVERTNTHRIAERRMSNYAYLHDALRDLALFPEAVRGWVPLGFPITCKEADGLCRHLASHRVFAPRHWRSLTSPEREFALEHELSRTEITLPCDQRYGKEHMERLVALVRGFRQ